MNRVNGILIALLAVVWVGCGGGVGGDPLPAFNGLVTEEFALVYEGQPVTPMGVALAPESDARWVLGETGDLFRLDATGELALVWSGSENGVELYDVCAYSPAELYVIAPGEGYRLNPQVGAFVQHFCVAPDIPIEWEEESPNSPDTVVPEGFRHVTRAIACDVQRGKIFAQPQTAPVEGGFGAPLRSEVSVYDRWSGNDESWNEIPDAAFLAGGMAVLPDGDALLGVGSLLFRFDMESWELVGVVSLSSIGVTRIEGLALGSGSELSLAVVDADSSRFLRIEIASLFQPF